MASDGKKFETLVGQSLDPYGFNSNSNSLKPLCDHTQFLRDHQGKGCVWEAKDCRRPSFPLAEIRDHERTVLTGALESNALAMVLIQWWPDQWSWRVFGALWKEWLEMEAEMGFVADVLYDLTGRSRKPKKPRRAPGTASIRLDDAHRPKCLHEVPLLANGDLNLDMFLVAPGMVLEWKGVIREPV